MQYVGVRRERSLPLEARTGRSNCGRPKEVESPYCVAILYRLPVYPHKLLYFILNACKTKT